MIAEIFTYSIKNLWRRRLRSFLTILSIFIGIAAIFALISFGQGIRGFINQMAQEAGTDKIFMVAGGFGLPGSSPVLFSDDDLDFVKKIRGVDVAAGMISASGRINFKDDKDVYTFVFGMPTETDEARMIEEFFGGFSISEGRNLRRGDDDRVVLGYSYTIPNRLFRRAVSLGDRITINDIPVRVIGFYEEMGSPTDDAQVYLTLEGARQIFGINDYQYIYIRADPDQDPTELADYIQRRFRRYKGQREGEEDFTVQTFEQTLETFGTIITILNGVLLLIALISIVVAGINITNTMYTSIMERTREIGIIKAIGAKNKFILSIFLVEAGILGLIGGILGITFGYLIAKAGEFAAASAGLSLLKPAFPIWLILGCLFFAYFVGSIGGVLPAIKASKLNPVDSLRYE